MVKALGDRLPTFTEEQSAMLKGSCDFFGVNHYSSGYKHMNAADGSVWASPYNKSGSLIGPFAESQWLNVYPAGIRGLLNWVDKRYNSTKTYIFENGVSVPHENDQPVNVAIHD
jgi:beta-glucosidase